MYDIYNKLNVIYNVYTTYIQAARPVLLNTTGAGRPLQRSAAASYSIDSCALVSQSSYTV